MGKKKKTSNKPNKSFHRIKQLPGVKHVHHHVKTGHGIIKDWWAASSIWQKISVWLITIVLLIVGSMYGIAQWYIQKHKHEPLEIGATFIASYARHYDLDPKATFQAMVDDLGIKRFRLVSYWDVHEPTNNKYDFSELDWQFDMAEQAGAKVSLAIGLRQPRWPECHMPGWAEKMPKEQWSVELKDYMKAVIERYKDRPALQSYQLENEYFMKVFGICPDHSRERLVDEYNFVKSLDSEHPVVISRSNNALGIPYYEPRPDQYGVSVYKRVWDKTITHRYIEYPFPAWFYGFLSGAGEIVTGKDMIIHELQAEPWPPTGVKEASLEEQDKSLNAKRLRDRIRYGAATGIRKVDLWGVEWWYWRKVVKGDPTIWDAGRETIHELTVEQGKSDGQL
jgi:hypothetical protein